MKRKIVSGVMLTFFLVGILTVAINPVKGVGTIYIRPDGSIDPPTAPIQRNGDIYTFTDDIYETIVVQRDNIIIDGDDYTLQGTGWGYGFWCLKSEGAPLSINNVIIKNTNIDNFEFGIMLNWASDSTISGNDITNVYAGVTINTTCKNNIVYQNNLKSNSQGVVLISSADNTVYENNIESNYYGVLLMNSSDNIFHHNNFINNVQEVYDLNDWLPPSICVWDDGYPSGGNYWSDYDGVDDYSGPFQDQPGSDGLGDTPYVIDANNQDNYPLMNPYIAGDVNFDGIVDTSDLSALGKAYGAMPGSPNWNVRADINDNFIVNVIDLFTLGKNFGKTVP